MQSNGNAGFVTASEYKMNYLPDTNILVNYFRGKDPERDLFTKVISSNNLYISVITIAEILAGAPDQEVKDLHELLSASNVVVANQEVAAIAGNYRRQFSRKTKKVYLMDCFIAASCKSQNLTLITNDKKDFPMKDIKIISPHV